MVVDGTSVYSFLCLLHKHITYKLLPTADAIDLHYTTEVKEVAPG